MLPSLLQMPRTWSLLLRVCQREGFLVPGRQEPTPLAEHTFIMNPIHDGGPGPAHTADPRLLWPAAGCCVLACR